MRKIKKVDFITDQYYLKIITLYTILLTIIYGYLVYAKNCYLWIEILVPTLIFIIGAGFFYNSLRKTANKRILSEQEQEEKNKIEE